MAWARGSGGRSVDGGCGRLQATSGIVSNSIPSGNVRFIGMTSLVGTLSYACARMVAQTHRRTT